MNLFKFGSQASMKDAHREERLLFASTAALERALDETDETYQKYFFAMYHCSPDEASGINTYREHLRQSNPANAAPVGRYFVLWGNEAFKALISYYEALSSAPTLSDEFRAYAKRRIAEITRTHQDSQALTVPIDLSEGQLSNDPNLTFYACLAIDNQQIVKQRE